MRLLKYLSGTVSLIYKNPVKYKSKGQGRYRAVVLLMVRPQEALQLNTWFISTVVG